VKNLTIVYGNHGRAIHLEDLLVTLRACFGHLGVRTALAAEPQPGCTNLLIEGFGSHFTRQVESMAKNARFVILGTEFVTGDTFNAFDQTVRSLLVERVRRRLERIRTKRARRRGDGVRPPSLRPTYSAEFQLRYRNFVKLSRLADAIWCLSEHQIEPYRGATGSKNVYQVEFGFVEGMPIIDHRSNEEKDIDFLFTGSLTPYRSGILKALTRRGFHTVAIGATTPGFIRNDFIARSKICLNLKQSEGWEYPSTIRFHYHLMNRSLLVTERTRFASEISDYVLSCDPAELLGFCEKLHAEGRYNERAAELHEKYRSGASMPEKFDRVLRESLRSD
jgi:hypothetical protein